MFIFALILTALMLCVFYLDFTRFIIPNWLVGSLLVLYPVMLMLTPAPVLWQSALVAMLVAFILGVAIFALRWMGGGDIKLLIVCVLWVGKAEALNFLMVMGILGGGLSLLLILGRPCAAWVYSLLKKPPLMPRVLRHHEPVPYGLAIATAFVILLWQKQIPGMVW